MYSLEDFINTLRSLRMNRNITKEDKKMLKAMQETFEYQLSTQREEEQ